MTNLLFEPPFEGLRGNIRTLSIARWKARSRLPIRDNWTFFSSCYGWDVISRYWSKSALYRGVGQFERKFYVEGDVAPNHCWYPETRVFLISHSEDCVILSLFIWIGHQRVTDIQMDGQTDGQTELPRLIQRCALQAMPPPCKNPPRDARVIVENKVTHLSGYGVYREGHGFSQVIDVSLRSAFWSVVEFCDLTPWATRTSRP